MTMRNIKASVVGTVGLIALGGSMLALGACASDSATGEPDSAGNGSTTVLVKPVTVLEGAAADDVTVAADRLEMPATGHDSVAALKAGDIVIGDRGAAGSTNSTGFLRKVVAVTESNGKLVVTTKPASLLEVVKEGEMTFQGSAAIGDALPTASASGAPRLGLGDKISLLDFSGKKLLDKAGTFEVQPGKTLGYRIFATVKTGTLDFTPSVDVGSKIKPDLSNLLGSLKEAHLIATGKLDAEAKIEVGLKLDGNATGTDLAKLIAEKITGNASTTLVDKQLSLGKAKLGPIPIPVNARFVAKLDCELKWGKDVSVISGAKASATVSAGFRYEKDAGVSPVFEHTENLDVIPPEWTINGDVMVECSVRPELSVNLFDMASGEVWIDAYAGLRGQAICDGKALTGNVEGEAFAGISGTVHAKLDAFGFNWEKECSLFSLATPPLEVTGSFPLGSDEATCTDQSATKFKRTKHDKPADSCFEGGSGTNVTDLFDKLVDAVTGGGGNSCGSKATTDIPTTWTCDAAKWGDCKCDCDCGTPDPDCTLGECGKCDHDACTSGSALAPTCSTSVPASCVKAICENDPYCCEQEWTESCIDHVRNAEYGCAAACAL